MTAPPFDQRVAAAIAPSLDRLGISANLVTAISLVLGLTGAGLFAWGAGAAIHWAAGVFAVSRFIDHIDGKLVRQTGKASRFGRYIDAVTGMISYGALFLGIGIGLWRGGSGQWTIVLPIVVALAIAINTALQLRWEAVRDNPPPSYPRIGPFQLEDGIYLIAPIVWLGGLFPFFMLGCLGTLLYLTVQVSVQVVRG